MDEKDFAELLSVFLEASQGKAKEKDGEELKAPQVAETQPEATELTVEPAIGVDEEPAGIEVEEEALLLQPGPDKTIIEAIAEQLTEEPIEEISTTLIQVADELELIQSPLEEEPSSNFVSETVAVEEESEPVEASPEMPPAEEEHTTLREILRKLIDVEGVMAALLTTRDGFQIESQTRIDMDLEMASAVIASSITNLQSVGQETGYGSFTQSLLEYEEGSVSLIPITSDVCLALVASKSAPLGRIRWETKKHKAELEQALS